MSGDIDLASNDLITDDFSLSPETSFTLQLRNRAKTSLRSFKLDSLYPNTRIRSVSSGQLDFQTKFGQSASSIMIQSYLASYVDHLEFKAGEMTLKSNLLGDGNALKNMEFLELDEITTPSALADHGKFYTKNDNKVYFQDGAGVEHEVILDSAGVTDHGALTGLGDDDHTQYFLANGSRNLSGNKKYWDQNGRMVTGATSHTVGNSMLEIDGGSTFIIPIKAIATRQNSVVPFQCLNEATANVLNAVSFVLQLKTSTATRTAANMASYFTNTTDADRTSKMTFNVQADGSGGVRVTIEGLSDGSARLLINDHLAILERSSDPPEPAEGECIIWMSDGTGKGDDGDVMVASKAGGTTNYGTLFDHSAGTAW